MKKFWIIGIAVIVFFVAGLVGYKIRTEKSLGKVASDFKDNAGDVIGTKSASTTTGVGFRITSTGGQSATTSYVKRINGSIAVYTIKALSASSTANLRWEIQGSNDDFCDTDGTGTDPVATSDINWFSVGDHSPNKAQTTSLGNASSTVSYVWNNPMVGVGEETILNNLTYRCLSLNVSGSSTVVWAQVNSR